VGLALDNDTQIERAGAHHHADQREPKGKFITDQLAEERREPSREYLLF